jgi:16S rRNA (cytidine1402-2'-O)-methyltransferase
MDLKKRGSLYLIPMPLGEGGSDSLSILVKENLMRLDHYVVERERTFRRYLKEILEQPRQERLNLVEVGQGENEFLLKIVEEGMDVGLVSEAGCPGIADPGSELVAFAHKKGINVVPLSGPSSIFLALMGSGFQGQEFHFHGYLPRDKGSLAGKLRRLEEEVLRTGITQIFIETPYRNVALLKTMTENLKKDLEIVVGLDLTLPQQVLKRGKVKDWAGQDFEYLDKRPAIFLLGL